MSDTLYISYTRKHLLIIVEDIPFPHSAENNSREGCLP